MLKVISSIKPCRQSYVVHFNSINPHPFFSSMLFSSMPILQTTRCYGAKKYNNMGRNVGEELQSKTEYFEIMQPQFIADKSVFDTIRDKPQFLKYVFNSLCTKDDLHTALELSEDYKKYLRSATSKQTVLKMLIRCHCDNGDVKSALTLLKDSTLDLSNPRIIDDYLEPIMTLVAQSGDCVPLKTLLTVLRKVSVDSISLVTLLGLVDYYRSDLNEESLLLAENVLAQASQHMVGLPLDNLKPAELGVLVETLADIRGEVIENQNLQSDCSVIAHSVLYRPDILGHHEDVVYLWDRPNSALPDASLPLGQPLPLSHPAGGDPSRVEQYDVVKERYFVAQTTQDAKLTSLPFSAAARGRASRVVDIGRDCKCPNCHTVLPLRQLSEGAKEEARKFLLERAWMKHASDHKKLKVFVQWLAGQEAFGFIVDGKNVAAHLQEKSPELFSWEFPWARGVRDPASLPISEMLRLLGGVVTAIRRQSQERILLVLPNDYLLRLNHRDEKDSPEEAAANESHRLQLRNNCVIFNPSPCDEVDDNLYWLTASLQPRRKDAEPSRPPRVVTNSNAANYVNMLSPTNFIEWVHSQVVAYRHNDQGETNLFGPASHTRLIQHESGSSRWHIPSVNSSQWLCFSTQQQQQQQPEDSSENGGDEK